MNTCNSFSRQLVFYSYSLIREEFAEDVGEGEHSFDLGPSRIAYLVVLSWCHMICLADGTRWILLLLLEWYVSWLYKDQLVVRYQGYLLDDVQ